MKGKPLTIRTMDLGDSTRGNVPSFLRRNPFWAAAVSGTASKISRVQRQLWALPARTPRPIKIMFPLITSTGEFRQAKYLVNDVMEDLDEEGIKIRPKPEGGDDGRVPPSPSWRTRSPGKWISSRSAPTTSPNTLAVDRTNEAIASMYNQPTRRLFASSVTSHGPRGGTTRPFPAAARPPATPNTHFCWPGSGCVRLVSRRGPSPAQEESSVRSASSNASRSPDSARSIQRPRFPRAWGPGSQDRAGTVRRAYRRIAQAKTIGLPGVPAGQA